MNDNERTVQSRPVATVRRVLAALLGAGGGARRPCRRLLPFALVPVVLLLVSSAAPARAACVGAPEILKEGTRKEFGVGSFAGFAVFATRAELRVHFDAKTTEETRPTVVFEFSSVGPSGPWQAAGPARFLSAEQGPNVGAVLIRGLTPATDYYARVRVGTSCGEDTASAEFTTTPVGSPELRSTTGDPREAAKNPVRLVQHEGRAWVGTTFAHLNVDVESDGAETSYRWEYATAGGGAWTPVPGCSGTVTLAAEFSQVECVPEGLSPETSYDVRAVAESVKGETSAGTGFATVTAKPRVFAGHPSEVGASSAVLHGTVIPDGSETDWRFEYATVAEAAAGHWTVGPEGVIPASEADEKFHFVEGPLTGLHPATAYEYRLSAQNSCATDCGSATTEPASFETAGPPLVATFAAHAIDGEDMRALGSVAPHGYDAHYHIDYVTQAQFEESGWASAHSTPAVDAGGGGQEESKGEYPAIAVGADLPGLQAGVSYRYRLVATNAAPGNPVVDGGEQMLTVPNPTVEPEGPCPNQALRSGASAHLPDCRAYEQVTPSEKAGTAEIASFGIQHGSRDAVGEDGGRFLLTSSFSKFGASPDPLESAYVFAREPLGAWPMSSASPQPEAGANSYIVQLTSPDLTQVATEVSWSDLAGHKSEKVSYETGPVGGPYATVATVPFEPKTENDEGGWVAASADFSTLVLQLEDRTLVSPHPTGTVSGADLYEYSGGGLRQLNVDSAGHTIGACGATPVSGDQGVHFSFRGGWGSGPHAVSAEGSRVFFEAVPGSDCSQPRHLYMRTGGTTTTDIGAYRFLAADAAGSKLLIANAAGEDFLYDTHTLSAKLLMTGGAESKPLQASGEIHVSADATTIYFAGGTERYDIPAETLTQALPPGTLDVSPDLTQPPLVSADGRYLYFTSDGVPGVPHPERRLYPDGKVRVTNFPQAYRYDSVERVVQCISCASPFDPEPRLPSTFFAGNADGNEVGATANLVPLVNVASANGDYVFFQTNAALVPSDVDGETPPECSGPGCAHSSFYISASSDVYEWRRDGIDGCARAQGCLALISSGTGGEKVMPLGTDPSGENVFFTTTARLASSDTDTAFDVYDARVGGGLPPPPPKPVECEGDACTSPPAAPIDTTPASLAFSGAGNLAQLAPAEPVKVKAQLKAKPCGRGAVRKRGRCVARKRTGRRAARRAVTRGQGGHR